MSSEIDIRLRQNGSPFTVEASRDALVLMAACVNEALEAVNDWEFSIRLGFSSKEARSLREQLYAILEQLPDQTL